MDMKRAIYHYKVAAIGGQPSARHCSKPCTKILICSVTLPIVNCGHLNLLSIKVVQCIVSMLIRALYFTKKDIVNHQLRLCLNLLSPIGDAPHSHSNSCFGYDSVFYWDMVGLMITVRYCGIHLRVL